MSIIKHEDIFDGEGFKKKINECEKEVKGFADSFDGIISRLSKQSKELESSLSSISKQLGNTSVKQGAFDGLSKAAKEASDYKEKLNEAKESQEGYNKLIDFTKASIAELKREYGDLKKQYESLKPSQKDYQEQVAAIGTRLKEVTPRLNDFTTAVKKAKNENIAAEGSYNALNTELVQLRNQLKLMPGAFLENGKGLNKNNQEAVALQQRIEGLSKTLIAADAAMSQHGRQVGNYSSGYNGLKVSISQLTREIPSTINNINSMFLAWSNNFPMVFDEINKIKAANVQLAASGEKPVSVLKQIGSAFFSWNTVMTAGVALLTLYGKDLVEWVSDLFKASEAIDSAKESHELLNKALKSSEYKNAVQNVQELTVNVDLAKKGFISKKDVVEQYNKTMGETVGQVKTLDEVERMLVKNGDAYIKMTLYKAAAQAALGKAADFALQAALTQQKKIDEFKNTVTDTRVGQFGSGTFNAAEYDKETARIKAAQEKRKQEAIKLEQDKANALKNIAADFQRQAAEIASTSGFSGSTLKETKAEENAAKKAKELAEKRQKALEESIRKQQELIEKAAELEIKRQELRHLREGTEEIDFQARKLEIIRDAVGKQIALENQLGKKADGSKIAGFKQKEIDAEIDFTKFLAKEQEERRKLATKSISDVVAAKEEARKKEEQIEEGQNDQFAQILKDRMNIMTDAENRRFALEEARRGKSLSAEIKHLQEIIRIRRLAGEDISKQQESLDLLLADKQKQIDTARIELMVEAANTALSIISESFRASSEARIQSLEREKENELKLAGNNAAAKEKIEADYNKRIAKEKTKQAQNDKLMALFQIAINTAAAIAKHLATPYLIPFDIAMGALQAVLVASRPIPKFKVGTKNAPKGLAVINEEGPELILRHGRMFVVKNQGPTLVNLAGGERIYTHQESKRILEGAEKAEKMKSVVESSNVAVSMSNRAQQGRQAETIAIMTRAMQGGGISEAAMRRVMFDTLAKQPVQQTIMDERGIRNRQIELNQRTEYLNKRFMG